MRQGQSSDSTTTSGGDSPRRETTRVGRFLGTDPRERKTVAQSSLADLGITIQTGWYVAAVLYGIGGAIFASLWLAGVVPAKTGYLGITAMALAAVFAACGRLVPNAPWGTHVLIGCGLFIITYGGIVDGAKHSAFVLLIMWPVLVPVYIFPARYSLPYLLAGTIACVVGIAVIDDPSAYAIVTGSLILAIGLTTVVSQRELRMMSRINGELAVTDPLTGIANLRRLGERMRDAIAMAERGGDEVALFVLDLDNFKQVNDRFGHQRGDDLLRAVAGQIAQTIGKGDLLARRGGDEFAVLATVRNDHIRDGGLDRLRSQLESAVRVARERSCPEVTPTATVGFVVRRPGETSQALLARADDALHDRKVDAHEVGERGTDAELAHHRRRLAHRGPAHQVSHTMRGSAAEVESDLKMARSIKRVLGRTVAWEMVAAIDAAMSLAVVGAMLTATGAELIAPLSLAATVALGLLAAFAVVASRRESGERAMHFVIVATLICTTAIVFSADALRPAVVDLYLGPMVCAFYAFPARRAFAYYWSTVALYAAALVTADYPYAVERIGMMLSVTLVMVVMLAKARRRIANYTVNAVKLSVVDPLTGAVNVRGLRRATADAIERSMGSSLVPALIAVDLDEFKLVNDRFGHSTGDRMLKAVTSAMHDAIRVGDTLARRGGDEFAAVCLVDGRAEANALAARLAARIYDARIELCPSLRATATVGTAIWQPGEDADDFLARADAELHGAKAESHAERDFEQRARA